MTIIKLKHAVLLAGVRLRLGAFVSQVREGKSSVIVLCKCHCVSNLQVEQQ